MAQLKFNDPAPDTELLNMDGAGVKISSLWQSGVLVLAFTRHFGCPQCKEMLDQLVQFKPVEGLVVKADLRKDLFVITIEILQRAVAIEMQGFQVERI